MLADQLRQSSDDLSRMVRTYAVTGNIKFEQQFREVLAIRNGEKPRPLYYNRIYWDLLTTGDASPPYPSGDPVSLKTLMKRAGFTKQELLLLEASQNKSDQLVALEQEAMRFIEQTNNDPAGIPDRQKAISILFSDKYHQAKIDILQPINKFLEILDNRTQNEVHHQAFLLQCYLFSQILTFTLIIALVVFFMLMECAKNVQKSFTAINPGI